MDRVQLSTTKIKISKDYNWIEYFKYNNSHLLKLDFSNNTELTNEEIKLITPSIKAFQIGEGSEGKHLMKVVEKFAVKNNYKEYPEIMKWFIIEENRHSQTLKKYMEIYNINTADKLWIDNIFRILRKMMGLECEIIILVTAEMIALSYYTALSNATNSELLKTICTQMLNDELRHVVLQSDTLHRISNNRNKIVNKLIRKTRIFVMKVTVFVVWHKYKELFLKGDYEYKKFKKYSLEYLKESIDIEKTGKMDF